MPPRSARCACAGKAKAAEPLPGGAFYAPSRTHQNDHGAHDTCCETGRKQHQNACRNDRGIALATGTCGTSRLEDPREQDREEGQCTAEQAQAHDDPTWNDNSSNTPPGSRDGRMGVLEHRHAGARTQAEFQEFSVKGRELGTCSGQPRNSAYTRANQPAIAEVPDQRPLPMTISRVGSLIATASATEVGPGPGLACPASW
jgi:hypothetical protein